MPTPIRVLIVDQVPDAERMAGELQTAGLAFEAARVQREGELRSALDEFQPDVVLSEYHLAGLGWMVALRVISEKRPNLPLIIVTDQLDTEPMAECLKAGAADYVFKQDVGRLAPAVLSALERARLRMDRERLDERRRRAELDLARQYAVLRAVLDSSDAAMCAFDGKLRYTVLNRAHVLLMKDLYGVDVAAGDLVEDGLRSAADDWRRLCGNLDRVFAGDPVVEEALYGAGERRRWLAVSYNPVRSQDSRIAGVVMVAHDVSERRSREDRLRLLSHAVEACPVSIAITDARGVIEYVNPRFELTSGCAADELTGTSLSRLQSPETAAEPWEEIWRRIQAGGEWEGEIQGRRKDGSHLWQEVHVSGVPSADGRVSKYVAVNEDVTERKRSSEALRRTEQLLMQAQKMEAVGRLAGGIAHDFNNLLSVVLGQAERVLKDLGGRGPLAERISQIVWSAQKGAALTRQLLAFGRRQVLAPRVVRLDSVVAEAQQMLERVIGEDVELVVARPAELGSVRADPGQVVQVLLNLAVNARDAMPRGGRLVFEFADVELDEHYASRHPPITPGAYVMLAVSDNGQGMDAETQRHIFEPFFTTKPEGQGTGLGLSTVYGIVKQSGGFVWVYSEVGLGTTFKVYLPRVDAPSEAAAAERVPEPPALPAQPAHILLAEDDDGVRELMTDLLKSHGHAVLSCSGPAQALRVAEQAPIELVVTDVIMPGMSGRELVQELRARRPGLKVLYVSGYAGEALARRGGINPGERFLQKPFSERSLLDAVSAALRDSAVSTADVEG